jgi:hypothetical protein
MGNAVVSLVNDAVGTDRNGGLMGGRRDSREREAGQQGQAQQMGRMGFSKVLLSSRRGNVAEGGTCGGVMES